MSSNAKAILDLQQRLEAAEAEIRTLRAAFLKIKASSWRQVQGGCWCRVPNTLKHTDGCNALRTAFEEIPDEKW